jgi:thioredoxin-like negative regulator of GroEL
MKIRGVRRWGTAWLLVSVAAGLAYVGWWAWRARRHQADLAEIRALMGSGRPAAAARKLAGLLTQEPDSHEAAYLLGLCEKARGRAEPAAAAWARISPDSPYAPAAILARAVLESDRGRLAEAERLLARALADHRIKGFDLRRFYASLCWHEGRIEEARRWIGANWEEPDRAVPGSTERAIELAQFHVAMSLGSSSVEAVRTFLDRTGRLDPEDDRIWLAKANLAIRRGEVDEAARWLDACLRRRPDDVPVWRARLNRALAAGRLDEVREALGHLPAAESSPAEVHRLAAWLAAHRGDAKAERRALERLIAADPGDGPALDRLAELARLQGQPDRAAGFRDRKAALDRLEARYKELFLRNQPVRNAVKMARMAEQLGRSFEAKAFWSIAVATRPDRDDLRRASAGLRHDDHPAAAPGQTLAAVLGPELDIMTAPAPRALGGSESLRHSHPSSR